MSVWDTFKKLGFFQSEDEDSEEEMDENEIQDQDEEEEDESQASRFAFFSNNFRRNSSARSTQPPDDEEDAYEDEPVRMTTKRGNVIHDSRMNARSTAQQEEVYTHRVRVIVVRQIEECREIIRYLLEGESIMLNLENVDPKDCARVVDLLSGAAFALQGRMLKVAHLSYLLAPRNIEVVEADMYVGASARYRS